ncbi:hypothetical protein HDU88_008339 [Geranomyces variabilis]|nr:hypothetical protein HDU88_008339 [Geranomyces variabilis]
MNDAIAAAMDGLETIVVRGVEYWRGDKKVPEGQFLYALVKNGEWSAVNDQSHPPKQAKVLLQVTWLRAHLQTLPSLAKKRKADGSALQPPAAKRTSDVQLEDIAPDVLELDDHEKFQDWAGTTFEIEARGERRIGAVYFRVTDLSLLIDGDQESMSKKLLHAKSSFIRGRDEDFVAFRESATSLTTALYLTYKGAMRAFATSRNPNARPFFEYAVRLVQISHIGSDADKVELAAKLAKADLRAAQYVFKQTVPPPSGVYLIGIGSLKDLRGSLGLTVQGRDDDVVVKFGRSEDCAQRLSDHIADYGALRGAAPTFLAQIAVNPFKAARAEDLVKRYFTEKGWMLATSGVEILKNKNSRTRNRDELALIPKTKIRMAKDEYKRLSEDFAGGYAELLAKNAALEREAETQSRIHAQHQASDEREKAYQTEIFSLKLDAAALRLERTSTELAHARKEIVSKDKRIVELERQLADRRA